MARTGDDQAGHARPLCDQQFIQGVRQAQILALNLKQIGIDVQVKYFFVTALVARVATRGEPLDLALSGWLADYARSGQLLRPTALPR